MINFYVSKEELEKALAKLEEAEDRGFVASQAVFRLARVDKSDSLCEVVRIDDSEFTGSIVLKSHPSDPNQNWGSVVDASWYKLEDGECKVI